MRFSQTHLVGLIRIGHNMDVDITLASMAQMLVGRLATQRLVICNTNLAVKSAAAVIWSGDILLTSSVI